MLSTKVINCAGTNANNPVGNVTMFVAPPVPVIAHPVPLHAIAVGVLMYGIGSEIQLDPL